MLVLLSTFLEVEDYLALPWSPSPFIIQDLLPVSGSLLLYAPPKAGKTWLSLGMARAIAAGDLEWNGFPIHTSGPVAYLQIDTPGNLFQAKYLRPIKDEAGLSCRDLLIADKAMVPFPFNILGEGGAWLKQALLTLPQFPVVVVIDTARELHMGDENDSGVMKNVVAALRDAVTPAAQILIAHMKKLQGDAIANLIGDNRGSSYLPGAVDCIMSLTAKDKRGVMTYQGRTIEEQSKTLVRHPSGLWILDQEEEAIVTVVRTRLPNESVAGMARRMMALCGASESTCRRRVKQALNLHD